MAKPESDEREIADDLMRFRAMQADTTDPVAMHFLHDIVADLEAELDERHRDRTVRCPRPETR